jgi:hypothetical protein
MLPQSGHHRPDQPTLPAAAACLPAALHPTPAPCACAPCRPSNAFKVFKSCTSSQAHVRRSSKKNIYILYIARANSGGRETKKLKKKLPKSPRALRIDNASTDVPLCATRKLAAGFGDFGAVASGWWPPQGRHGPRLASASPGLCRVAGLMWPGGTGTASVGAAGGRLRWHRCGASHPAAPSSIQPSRSPTCTAMSSLSSHARTALSQVRWLSAAWAWAAPAAPCSAAARRVQGRWVGGWVRACPHAPSADSTARP